MFSTYGFILGKRKSVKTYANNHLDAERILKIKPFFEHLIKDSIVSIKYIISKIEINLKIF